MAEDDDKKRRDEEMERGKALRAKSMEEFAERTKGKPTPTQDENDRATLGEHILEHEADGSNPDENVQKAMESRPGGGGGYQTRQAQPTRKPSASSAT